MADFEISYKKSSKHEGGYANVSGDRGGVTYAGISYVYWPKWEGWEVVFSKERKWNEIIPELNGLVKKFYLENFWRKMKGDLIFMQEYADELYDQSIHSSVPTAIRIAQGQLGLKKTGFLSKQDLEVINGIA